MAKTPSRTWLIWLLVALVFGGLVVFWIPSLARTVQSLTLEIGKGTGSSFSQISNEWTLAQKQIQEMTDKVSAASKSGSTLSPEQVAAFAKEIDAHSKEDPAAFPVHEDDPTVAPADTNPASAYCTRNGGRAVERKQQDITYSVCIFKDSTECEVNAFADGQCRQGQYRSAEEGIKKVPDLVLEVQKAGYCTARTQPIQWTDDATADYICLEGVTIKNIGWGDASASAIRTAGKYYTVPAIKAGDHYTFSDPFPFIKAKVNNQAVIVVDAKGSVNESVEDNNIYSFPQ